MSITFLFYTHFSQIRYQIKAKTPTHIAKHTELFLFLPFVRYSLFFLVRQNFFERVYLQENPACKLSGRPGVLTPKIAVGRPELHSRSSVGRPD